MATTPRDRLNREKNTIDELADVGELSRDVRDALLEWADALDGETTRRKYFDADGSEKTYAPRSIEAYLQSLRLCVERGCDLLKCSAEEFNAFIDGQHDDRGLSKTTLARYQSAARTFYRYHDTLGVDPDDIHVYSERSPPRHDEQDMFTHDEVDALREACETPRDRAFLELLIFTGQRITALQTLRIRDADVQEGVIYLNDDVDGLKGAADRGRKRPMFGARKYVRDWLQYHPRKDDPDAPLFVGDPKNHRTNLDEPWSDPGIRQHLKRIADRAGVDKPVNPHNFRHYFVTVMKRDYDLDSDTLRSLLGVAPDSTILETVYAHVTNDEYVEKAEIAVGYREPERESPMTPDACPTCGELLKDHWRRCPSCDELFGPDIEQLAEETDAASDDALDEALDSDDPLSAEERQAVRTVLEAIDDPVTLADELESSN
ncbi:site-specific integrase [Salinilacihabitans rarus]|uniref:site-specific integrase n=1 Tax=Salinilacihabitans rarus TaxID=2961596 RepID=UPI0020C917EA|nr:site-specific integrase [Salinilacihabitans rarus]